VEELFIYGSMSIRLDGGKGIRRWDLGAKMDERRKERKRLGYGTLRRMGQLFRLGQLWFPFPPFLDHLEFRPLGEFLLVVVKAAWANANWLLGRTLDNDLGPNE
jgi:hypothetical protein